MFKWIHTKTREIPTPVAGLALGIASMGWCLENLLPLDGRGQTAGAVIAGILLCMLTVRFICHPDTLHRDLKHPVVGSIVPTFAMATMVVSKALGRVFPVTGEILWFLAVGVHLVVLALFIWHRARDWQMNHMVPSWFVPPVGIVVADVTCPGAAYTELALILLAIGLTSYLVMLPLMVYRLVFRSEVPDAAKPTIAIMAAPASLSLAGYLTVVKEPSLLVCAVLLSIALLMTLFTYIALFHLMRLPFTPGYAAFTFPMAIGATALYKMAHLVAGFPQATQYAEQLRMLATGEAVIAALVIAYVSARFCYYYLWPQTVRFRVKSPAR